MTLVLNARFLTQPLTGVQRYATELVGALDRRLARDPDLVAEWGGVRAYVPAGKAFAAPGWDHIRVHALPGGTGHAWEQTALWRASRDAVLLSLGNSGPLLHGRQVLALHDAHIYDMPDAFTRRYRHLHRWLRPKLARRARRLLTVSPWSAARLAGHLGIAPERFTILPNSAEHVLRVAPDPGALEALGLTPRGYLLSVGTQSPNKNIAALIAAHAGLGPALPPLVVVGSTGAGLRAQRLAGDGRVVLAGRVSEPALRSLYEGAQGFVFPSLHEGFGLPPLEAMALGTPVLAARRTALPDTLGQAVLWFDPGQPESLSAGLRALVDLRGPDRDAYSRAGRAQAARFNWDRHVDILLAVLRQARGAAPRPIASRPARPDPAPG
jgi:glycosyltransferase involved in cell wall biosynthesis